MEERIIIKSERNNILQACLIVFGICAVIAMILWYELNSHWWIEKCMERINYGQYHNNRQTVNEATMDLLLAWLGVLGFGAGVGAVCSLIFYWWAAKTEITLTDKRVYGKTVFGKRVDLPFDSVSAVGSCWPKGIAVATSSGRITFLMIGNRDEIHKCITDLLIERQRKPVEQIPQSDANELRKYKELLDGGIISQDEFDAKKKQLLGL